MRLYINPLHIEIDGLERDEIPANSLLFEDRADNKMPADVSYTFHFVDSLSLPSDWKPVFKRDDIIVFKNGELEARLLAVGSLDACYALYRERNKTEADVYFISALKEELRTDTIFASCLSLERHLAPLGCYILHCAYLNYRNQAILFSGPSGIGKSTHADIWCRNITDTNVLNGDRALLCPSADGGYEAHGWIVCGSSGICHNETRPLKAIVFIDQATDNHVRQMSLMQNYKQLTSQITINWWNERFTRKALDDLQALQEKTDILTYSCNMQPEAAQILNRYLTERGTIR